MDMRLEKRIMTNERAAIAQNAAIKAGEHAHARQGSADIHSKGNTDYVTDADRECQELIIEEILKEYPNAEFINEEDPSHKIKDAFWTIDPIDGTLNYMQGAKEWGVSIAYVEDDQVQVGAIYIPSLKELYYAAKGRGAYKKTDAGIKRLHVSDEGHMQNILGSVDQGLRLSLVDNNKSNSEISGALVRTFAKNTMRMRDLGCAVMHLAYIAEGTWGYSYMPKTNVWDIAAGALLIEEAGGAVQHINGKKLKPNAVHYTTIFASNGKMYKDLKRHVTHIKKGPQRSY